jgi:phosphatase NudJ
VPRDPIPTWFSAVAVVRRPADGRFLLVHERRHRQPWYPPAGRVEPGESCAEAAVRETR